MSYTSSSSLVPIRVDVFFENNLRIVDTLLLDPNLLDDNDNAYYLAYTILSEAEVMGMGRTVRHFTGRLDLYNQQCLQAMVDCIRPQLETIRRKRKNEMCEMNNKRIKRDTTTTTTMTTTAETKQEDANKEEENPDTERDNDNKLLLLSNEHKSHLIPIRIRLSVHGVRIHDDFDWDPSITVSPLEMASCMGQDLQLSEEAIQAIAISICEQVHGLQVNGTNNKQQTEDEGGPSDCRNTTAAWHLDQRTHITNVAHLVAQHRK